MLSVSKSLADYVLVYKTSQIWPVIQAHQLVDSAWGMPVSFWPIFNVSRLKYALFILAQNEQIEDEQIN